MEIEQSFFGDQEEWEDFLFNFAVSKESDADNVTVISSFIVPDRAGYTYLRIGYVTKLPMTEDEKAERGLAAETEGFTFGSIELGKIRYKMFSGKTVWKGRTDDLDCFMWAKALAERIKKLELGSDPIINDKPKSLINSEQVGGTAVSP